MCFKTNKSLFKTFNFIFILINTAFVIASIVTMSKQEELVTYYKISITHDQHIDVHLIYFAILMNISGFFAHTIFYLATSQILENQFLNFKVNNGRWVHQFLTVGLGISAIMAINGFKHLETFLIAITLYAAIISLCYFEDQYLNKNFDFLPTYSPHFFAIPLYVLMIAFIMVKSMENIHSLFTGRLAIVTTISLMYTSSFFIIQKLHIFYCYRVKSNDVKQSSGVDDDEESETVSHTAKLDEMLHLQRSDIKFEIFHYVNIAVFQTVISWVLITLTRNESTLLPEPTLVSQP